MCFMQSLGLDPQPHTKQEVVNQHCSPNGEVDIGGLEVHDYSQLRRVFGISLRYVRPFLKTTHTGRKERRKEGEKEKGKKTKAGRQASLHKTQTRSNGQLWGEAGHKSYT